MGEQNGVRGGLEIGRDLHRDALLRASQQRIRQAEDAGTVGVIGIDGDAKQEPDDQADTAQRQANMQQSVAPPRPLGQGINIDIDNVSAVCQTEPLLKYLLPNADSRHKQQEGECHQKVNATRRDPRSTLSIALLVTL